MNCSLMPSTIDSTQPGKKHTLSPTCTGTSVVGLKYADGVVIAADMLVSYGSLARYMDFERVIKVNDSTVIACSGDMADFQLLKRRIDQHTHMDALFADGFKLGWITRVLYSRRSQMNPLWNTYIVGGLENDVPYLGYCDLLGVSYREDYMATGFGNYLAVPILRRALDDLAGGDAKNLTEENAVQTVTDALRLLYFRDCRAHSTYQLAYVRPEGVEIEGPLKLETDWSVAEYVCGYE